MLLSFKAGTNLFMKGSVNNLVTVNVATVFGDDKLGGKTSEIDASSNKRIPKNSINQGLPKISLVVFEGVWLALGQKDAVSYCL